MKQLTMCDDNVGWGLTLDNEILFTENGIKNFKSIRSLDNTNNSTNGFTDTAFINEQTAYVTYFSSDNEHLVVEYTKNSGASWQQTLIKYGDYAVCDAGSAFISFADDTEGYLLYCSTPALGQMIKLLFYTDNAGASFTFTSDLTNTIAGYPQGITAGSKDFINVAVTYHGTDTYLYQTSDGAKTWENIEIFPRTDEVNYVDGYAPIFYEDALQKGAIVLKIIKENAVYELFTTKNAGISWTSGGKIPCDSLLHYSITNAGQIYIIDQSGTLYKKL
ncbi:MAG: hypothetical protein K2M91_13330 [Lachnospiraceae bacterium]|nr:hypothetical protein [Lachnospiraceae bacterium]